MSKKVHVTTTVNHEPVEFLCEPRQSLLEVLRDAGVSRRPTPSPSPSRTTVAGAMLTPAAPATTLDLGGRRYDIANRALVMGILNRTPDSFYDKGATYALDELLRRAEQLVDEGADLLDV
ncbi:MAG: dihydropteroate synthase, partial [Isosphaeraceae bacterium]